MYYWQELLCAVDQCFKALPTSEHKSLAQKWVGSGDEFMTFDLMSDPVLLTKYNAMVHKAHQLKRAQVTTDAPSCLSHDMHSCTATTPVSPTHYSLCATQSEYTCLSGLFALLFLLYMYTCT